jgi:hemolysin activation/secretion protein
MSQQQQQQQHQQQQQQQQQPSDAPVVPEAPSPAVQLAAFEAQLRSFDEQVHRIDLQLVDLEKVYLETTKASVARGLDFYASNRPVGSGARARQQRVRLKDRIFSLSSAQNSALAESAHFNGRQPHADDDDLDEID